VRMELDDGVVVDGSMVYQGAGGLGGLVIRPTEQGVQALIVVESAAAPSRYSFSFESPSGAVALVMNELGRVEIRDATTGIPLGDVQPPWARDADGRAVPTWFELDGAVLTQVVNHAGFTYPVTADPETCGWVTCTYYFGKRATSDIAAGGSMAAVCAALGAIPIAGWLVAAVCAGVWETIVWEANRAKDRGKCLKIKYPRPPFGAALSFWPGMNSGGSCR
jgi:hypothetical protein